MNLLISIIKTIATNPGTIPDFKEWDMNTAEESLDEDLVQSIRGINNFSNAVIEKHT
jgi:hypothetical protein